MDKDLILLRGVPGAGKSTLAAMLCGTESAVMVAADDFMYEDGVYKFSPSKLGNAHAQCLEAVRDAMASNTSRVIVHNTLTTAKELAPYINAAEEYGYRVFSLVVENRHGSKDVHNVPEEVRQTHARRLSQNLKLL